ncbi:MAG: SGNH/GDSL hydrolase family protein [Candidatus Levybacteria bacterium]|nr:SGNH/GDSL hydrolase family protein [Candidatus Levybacteria bacterium]
MNNWIISIIVIVCIIGGIIFLNKMNTPPLAQDFKGIRYVALGDSYTIGEGASTAEAWPSLLTEHLKKDRIDIELIANPSVTGWTTQDVINNELRIYDASNPTFATLLIGVNDWVQGVPKETFRANLIIILDRMQAKLPDKSNLILVTIPDFSVSPRGMTYGNGRDIAQGIAEFNEVIKEEAQKRNLQIVDIYPLSQEKGSDPSMIAADTLHPSAKMYAEWEKLIYPVVYEMLR